MYERPPAAAPVPLSSSGSHASNVAAARLERAAQRSQRDAASHQPLQRQNTAAFNDDEALQVAMALSAADAADVVEVPGAGPPEAVVPPPAVRQSTDAFNEELAMALAVSAAEGEGAPPSAEAATQQEVGPGPGPSSFESDLSTALARSMESDKCWAKGVGCAFDILSDNNQWAPIIDAAVVDQLGRLVATNATTEVTYELAGRQYRAVAVDGMLRQTEGESGGEGAIRLVPFFFEMEERADCWVPIREPEALSALSARAPGPHTRPPSPSPALCASALCAFAPPPPPPAAPTRGGRGALAPEARLRLL